MAVTGKRSRATTSERSPAWVFQFREDSSRDWRNKVRVGSREEWVASQYRKQMQVHDLAFIWMSTPKGGLCGWGIIVDTSHEKAATIEIGGWLEKPVPRDDVYSKNAIRPENLLRRNPQGTNFPLTREEAVALCAYLPNGNLALTKLQTVQNEPGKERADASSFDRSLRDRLAGMDIETATPEVSQILLLAASYVVGRSGTGQVTTTRLLLAFADWKGRPGRDGFAAEALRRALSNQSLHRRMSDLRSDYRKEQSFTQASPKAITLSANVARMIAEAVRISAETHAPFKMLTADSLAVTLLAGEGNVRNRALRRDLPLDEIISAMRRSFANSEYAQRFDLALRLAGARGESAPPTPVATSLSSEKSVSRGIGFANLGNDDPWSGALDDQLGASAEAQAFARAAAARSFEPPLAFGIFGDWGSGKSYFMRLIHAYVDDIANGRSVDAGTGEFLSDIVQIRFNAWHYVDQNLWASLVDHIFTEIDGWVRARNEETQDPLLEKLVTARELTLEAAMRLRSRRREQRVAMGRLSEAESRLASARAAAKDKPGIIWDAFKQVFAEEAQQNNDLRNASSVLGIDQAARDADAFRRAASDLTSEAGRARMAFRGLWNQLTTLRTVAIFIAVVAGAALLKVGIDWAVLVWLRSELANRINVVVVEVGTILGGAALLMKSIASRIRSSIEIIDDCRARFDAQVERRVSEQKKDVEKTETELVALVAEAEVARSDLAQSTARLAEAAREFADEDGHGRLIRFIRARTGEQGYGKHLGLVATIRKDFAELSSLVSGVKSDLDDVLKRQADAYANRLNLFLDDTAKDELLTEEEMDSLKATLRKPNSEARAFSRVVLYIDDLDRCPPERVVDVLQAVHLLLTFPVFVIFVAVDARWVGRSLQRHYGSLLGEGMKATSGGEAATALDYLEKIFQVPYRVRRLDPATSSKFLRARASSRSGAGMLAEPSEGVDRMAGTTEVGGSIDAAEETSDGYVGGSATPSIGREHLLRSEGELDQAERPVASAIAMTDAEAAFMERIAVCVGDTPRRALRFLNSYRVIKAGLDAEGLENLEKREGYRSLMVQLALATASPASLPVLRKILEGEEPAVGLRSAISDPRLADDPQADEYRAIAAAVGALFGTAGGSSLETLPSDFGVAITSTIDPLRHYGAVAARYTFGQ